MTFGGIGSHAYSEHDFEGLDIERLNQALNRLISRHGMLRAVIDGPDSQRVLADVPPVTIESRDLSNLGELAKRLEAERLRDELSHQVRQAGEWPMFSVGATKLSATCTRLHFSIDALICDVGSYSILIDELRRLYDDPESELPSIETRFVDVVQERFANRSARNRAWSYWNARIPELPSGPELPVQAEWPAGGSMRFARLASQLGKDRWAALREYASEVGVTPSALVLTTFGDVLERWSRAASFSVMLTTFDRPAGPGFERLVGDFTSLLIVEFSSDGVATFDERARLVQRDLWSGLDNLSVDGVEVLGQWARYHEVSAAGSLPVVFTSTIDLDTGGEAASHLLGGEQVFAVTQTPQVLLDHQVGVVEGELHFNWDYVAGAFPPGLIEDMWESYLDQLDQIASHNPAPANRLPVRQRLELQAANDTSAPMLSRPLFAGVVDRLLQSGSQLAVVTSSEQVTYDELADRVSRLADRLAERGLGPEDTVTIELPKGVDQVVAVLGVSCIGATWVPIDPGLPTSRRAVMRNLCEAALSLGPEEFAFFSVAEDQQSAPREVLSAQLELDPDSAAYIIFTSGTTGIPKGVVIRHRSALNTVHDINQRFGVTAGDVVLGLSALSFDLSVYDIFGPLAVGATLVLPSEEGRRSPSHWLEQCKRWGVTVWNSVPALMQLALEADLLRPESSLSTLRLAMMSGDWIPLDLPSRLRDRVAGMDVISLGGATEGSIWSIFHRVDSLPPDWPSIPYGRPLDNQTMHVLDVNGRDRPEWVAGELYIGGVGVAIGYLGDPVLTSERFPEDPQRGRLYRTGDLARRRPGGILEFLGREDGQVKISGMRLELGEVEAAIRDDGEATDVVVSTFSRDGREKRLVAYLVTKGHAIDASAIRKRLQSKLPGHAIPSFFVELDRLPLSANGKVDRGALPDPLTTPISPSNPPVSAGSGRNEDLVRSSWLDALDLEDLDRDESFWDAGGTSAIAISILTGLSDQLGCEATLGLLYEHPTIARLAAALTEMAPGRSADSVIPDLGSDDAPFPLTAVQEAYWLGRRSGFDLAGASAHNYFELDITDLDLSRFQRSLQSLIERHGMLRTLILDNGTQQTMMEAPEYEVEIIDLRDLNDGERERRLELLRKQWAHRRYDPARWPLFGVRALRIEDRITRLQLSIDLIVVDTHCLLTVQRDLLRIYENDGTDPGPALGCTFRDYVLSTRVAPDSDRYRRDMAYWDQIARSLPPPPALPFRTGAMAEFNPTFERLQFEMDAGRWSELKELASGGQVSPTVLLLSSFGEVVQQWSGRQPFTLNLPTLHRVPIHPQIEDVVGDFTSTTLVVVPAEPADLFDRARVIQQQLWSALDHGAVSGVEVLRHRRRLDPDAPTLMPIVFTSQLDYPTSSAEQLPPIEAKRVYGLTQTAQVLLDAQASEHDGTLFVSVDYVPAAFIEGVVPAMIERFAALLEGLGR